MSNSTDQPLEHHSPHPRKIHVRGAFRLEHPIQLNHRLHRHLEECQLHRVVMVAVRTSITDTVITSLCISVVDDDATHKAIRALVCRRPPELVANSQVPDAEDIQQGKRDVDKAGTERIVYLQRALRR